MDRCAGAIGPRRLTLISPGVTLDCSGPTVLTHDGSLIGATRWRDDGLGGSRANRWEQKCPRCPQNLRV